MQPDDILNGLYRFGGMDRGAFAGTQFDIMPTAKHLPNGSVVDAALCDHTCATTVTVPDHEARQAGHSGATKQLKTGGCYDCDASAGNNKGLDPNGLAEYEQLVTWLEKEIAAQKLFHQRYMDEHFADHCDEFKICDSAKNALIKAFVLAIISELNLFGGSPGMRGDSLDLARWAQSRGLRANLTDTGRPFLNNENFARRFFAQPVNVLALSFDDLKPDELSKLFSCTDKELHALWAKSMREEPLHGQKHKAYEGVYAGKMVTEKLITGNPEPPTLVMFNSVFHPGNIDYIPELVSTIAQIMPRARLNPYPAQSSFEADPKKRVPCWEPKHLPKFEKTLDWLIDQTVAGNPNITMRLQYYLFLKAQFMRFRDEPEELCRRLSGWHGWRSDRRPGAYRYAEISGSGTPWGTSVQKFENGRSRKAVLPSGGKTQPGGHMGSYWYQWAVDGSKQIHDYSVEELAEIKLHGSVSVIPEYQHLFGEHIMPRLTFNIMSTEAGMDPEVVPYYLELRALYFGY